jgi:hypothetical protein
MRDEFFYRKFGDLKASQLATNDLRKYIVDHLLNKVNDDSNEIRFVILLGHDNTLSALLSTMEIF